MNNVVSEDDPPSTCGGCTSLSTRKAATLCSACGVRWHTMCAGLKVREAQALPVWHCPNCRLGRGTPSSQFSQHTRGSQPTSPPASSMTSVPHSRLAELRDSCPVLKRIPKSARASVADSLSSVIDGALSQPSVASWTRFLSFAFAALRAPNLKTQRVRTSIASTIKKQLRNFNNDHQCLPSRPEKPAKHSQETVEKSIPRRVLGKCADGDIKAALRILTSSEEFIQPSIEARDALLQKHPPAPADEALPPAPNVSDDPALTVTEEQVQAAIRTMPPGSAAGLDGMRPMHLKQLTSA